MNNYSNSIVARVFDIFWASVFIILLSPFFVIISLLILLDGTGGSILVLSPERVKKNGKLFRMYKFRYMVPDAHNRIKQGKYGKKMLKKWRKNGGKLSIDEDPRITPIGRILRMTDFDEIPQLFNVIMGDMSIVGPRPYIKEEISRYKKEYPNLKNYFEKILSVKPGITGLWQISGRNSLPLKKRIILDAEGAMKKSLISDFLILVKTPYIVITRKGAI